VFGCAIAKRARAATVKGNSAANRQSTVFRDLHLRAISSIVMIVCLFKRYESDAVLFGRLDKRPSSIKAS
jgi:hypothetical protein